MDELKAPGVGQVLGVRPGLAQIPAVQHDAGAEGLGARHLGERGAPGHDDGRRNVPPPGVERHPLGVIAGRRGDDSGLGRGGVHGGQPDQRPARLEGAGVLQVLQLENHLRPAQGRDRLRGNTRRAQDLAVQHLGGGADIVKGNGHGRLSLCGRRGRRDKPEHALGRRFQVAAFPSQAHIAAVAPVAQEVPVMG